MSSIQASLEALKVYLQADIPTLEQIHVEFPSANLQLKYPSITMDSGEPKFTPLTDPDELSISTPDDHYSDVVRVIGMFDAIITLDLWTKTKPERLALIDAVFAALCPDPEIPGLRLQLSAYYDIWVEFSITSQKLDATEASSQRGEWRATIKLLANVREVASRNQAIITEPIENNFSTPSSIE